MKILYLTSRLPYPPYRGDKLRNWIWLTSLSKKHDIILVTFVASKEEAKLVRHLQNVCKQVYTVYLSRWRSIINCLIALWRRIPFQVAYYQSREMHSLIRQLVECEKPDILHTHLTRMVQYTESFKNIPSVLDIVDAISRYLQSFLSTSKNLVIRRFLSSELIRIQEYEKRINRYDRIFVCSEPDLQIVKKAAPRVIAEILDNGVDTDYYKPDRTIKADMNRLIFTGNMAYYPNIDGVRYFVKNIFPVIQSSIPTAKLFIVGQSPPRSVRNLGNEYIHITGFVPDIRLEYIKSCIAVSPIRFGSGTLNKVLEPMALGIPVVASVIGIDGLGLEYNREIIVANDPEEFANKVIMLLRDPELRKKISIAGMRAIRKRFDWKKITKKLLDIEEEVVRDNINHKR